MATFPTAEESLTRLHASGWSVGELRAGSASIDSGCNGENAIGATGSTSAEAGWRAREQAVAVEMLRR
jgi:hypothetical protein